MEFLNPVGPPAGYGLLLDFAAAAEEDPFSLGTPPPILGLGPGMMTAAEATDLRSTNRRLDSTEADALGNKHPRIASEVGHSKVQDYLLHGVTLGFVNTQLDIVQTPF
jgi:hypothetical protein